MRPVFLIGYMGAGKTTISKRLAANLALKPIDLDVYIEQTQGCSIADIFKQRGEKVFREIERNALKEVSKTNMLIATGGGTPCFFDNMIWMNRRGITIYLDTPVEILFGRLRVQKNQRPLIKQFNDKGLKQFISEQLAYRNQFYRQAHIFFNSQVESLDTLRHRVILCVQGKK